ncbi:MAG: hypothetical protein SF182_23515 [Deltaproteobacteria bacterium]|nr:hypothetical protein [Deltaproteobacteria bacterium]
MSHDIERELRDVDWAAVGIRLTAYATWKARNRQWRTGRSDALAGGRTPEDLAAEAVLKVLSGERAWDPARGALLPYLEGVVDSLLSHLADSLDNRIQERWSDTYDRAADGGAHDDPVERIEALRAAVQRSAQPALLAVLAALAAGCEAKPQALAAQLATSVADVNNRLKRLRRLAQQIIARRADEVPPR